MALGVYVHIPFCADRCDYCDFATWTDRGHLIDGYVAACVEHAAGSFAGGARATSVFFGGGTPSLIPAAGLTAILDAIPRADGAEVTVECNPDSVDDERLVAYAAAGVNRLSFGVQSMQAHVLAELGRTHDPDNVRGAVRSARAAGFRQLNLDLIYGSPSETVDDWRSTLDAVLELGPDHVSAYALTVEPGTPLGQDVARGARAAPDDDDQAAKYELADDVLTAAGLGWYEISNWAPPGAECRHNLVYWEQGDYVAIGAAAHGHVAGRRHWNVRTPERYMDAITAGRSPEAGHEDLDASTRAEEAVFLALRTRGGIPVAAVPAAVRDELVADGLLVMTADRLVLTRHGRLLASDVTARLLLAGGPTAAPQPVALGTIEC